MFFGNLVEDPVLRNIAGNSVTTLRIAVNTTKKETLFVDITFWDKKAEMLCEYFTKGRKIGVEYYVKNKVGKINAQEFGTYEFVGTDFLFLDKKENE